MKSKKYITVGVIPKSNIKIVESGKIEISLYRNFDEKKWQD